MLSAADVFQASGLHQNTLQTKPPALAFNSAADVSNLKSQWRTRDAFYYSADEDKTRGARENQCNDTNDGKSEKNGEESDAAPCNLLFWARAHERRRGEAHVLVFRRRSDNDPLEYWPAGLISYETNAMDVLRIAFDRNDFTLYVAVHEGEAIAVRSYKYRPCGSLIASSAELAFRLPRLELHALAFSVRTNQLLGAVGSPLGLFVYEPRNTPCMRAKSFPGEIDVRSVVCDVDGARFFVSSQWSTLRAYRVTPTGWGCDGALGVPRKSHGLRALTYCPLRHLLVCTDLESERRILAYSVSPVDNAEPGLYAGESGFHAPLADDERHVARQATLPAVGVLDATLDIVAHNQLGSAKIDQATFIGANDGGLLAIRFRTPLLSSFFSAPSEMHHSTCAIVNFGPLGLAAERQVSMPHSAAAEASDVFAVSLIEAKSKIDFVLGSGGAWRDAFDAEVADADEDADADSAASGDEKRAVEHDLSPQSAASDAQTAHTKHARLAPLFLFQDQSSYIDIWSVGSGMQPNAPIFTYTAPGANESDSNVARSAAAAPSLAAGDESASTAAAAAAAQNDDDGHLRGVDASSEPFYDTTDDVAASPDLAASVPPHAPRVMALLCDDACRWALSRDAGRLSRVARDQPAAFQKLLTLPLQAKSRNYLLHLCALCGNGHDDFLVRWLIATCKQRDFVLNVEQQNERLETALHVSAALGGLLTLAALVDAGASVIARDAIGATPLHRLAASDAPQLVLCVRKLAVSGELNANARDERGDTPLHWWVKSPQDTTGDFAVYLCGKLGANPLAADNAERYTPFHTLVRYNTELGVSKLTALLRVTPLPVNVRCEGGSTLFHLCAQANGFNMMRALFEAIDFDYSPLTLRDDEQRRPCDVAGSEKMRDWLLTLQRENGVVDESAPQVQTVSGGAAEAAAVAVAAADEQLLDSTHATAATANAGEKIAQQEVENEREQQQQQQQQQLEKEEVKEAKDEDNVKQAESQQQQQQQQQQEQEPSVANESKVGKVLEKETTESMNNSSPVTAMNALGNEGEANTSDASVEVRDDNNGAAAVEALPEAAAVEADNGDNDDDDDDDDDDNGGGGGDSPVDVENNDSTKNETEAAKVVDGHACAICGEIKARSEYSKSQWKKKNGEGKCSQCVQ